MDGRAEEEKEGKGLGVLSSDQNFDRSQAKGHSSRTKRRSARKRQATEKGAQQDNAREKHRRDSKKFYYKHREVILSRQREYYRNHSERILAKQKEYKQKREAKKWDPLHMLAEVCQQVRDGTSSGNCNDASTSADVNASTTSPSTLPCTPSSEKPTS